MATFRIDITVSVTLNSAGMASMSNVNANIARHGPVGLAATELAYLEQDLCRRPGELLAWLIASRPSDGLTPAEFAVSQLSDP